MNTDELILALQGEHELEYELLSELISVLEKIKDTEDDEEIEVIKKVLVFRKTVYDSGNTSYVLPEELEYLNDLYLPEEDVPEDTDSTGDSTDTDTPEDVVVLTEEEEMVAEIKELLKGDKKYNDICNDLVTAEENLKKFTDKSNATINKKKTVIFNLAYKKEVLERGVKDTIIMKKIREVRENKELIATLKKNETNK